LNFIDDIDDFCIKVEYIKANWLLTFDFA